MNCCRLTVTRSTAKVIRVLERVCLVSLVSFGCRGSFLLSLSLLLGALLLNPRPGLAADRAVSEYRMSG